MPPRPDKPVSLPNLAEIADAIRPIGLPKVVTVGGITGIFTPVTDKPDRPLTDDERKNLQALIEQLTKQVADLQAANAALSEQLEALRNPPRSPEEFTSAIQHTVDELQQKLSAMTNPVSSFAVKDFRLEAKVMIDVSPLGAIEYRFIRPGDPVDPNALSHVAIDLVPIPKDGAARTWTPDLFQPNVTVDALPDITTAQARTLEQNQIFTVGDFLQVGTRARASAELVSLLRIERRALTGWMQQAELLTLKGTNSATVEVLTAAGFESLDAIARATPEALLSRYLDARKAAKKTRALAATLDDATRWVTAARRYTGLAPKTNPEPDK